MATMNHMGLKLKIQKVLEKIWVATGSEKDNYKVQLLEITKDYKAVEVARSEMDNALSKLNGANSQRIELRSKAGSNYTTLSATDKLKWQMCNSAVKEFLSSYSESCMEYHNQVFNSIYPFQSEYGITPPIENNDDFSRVRASLASPKTLLFNLYSNVKPENFSQDSDTLRRNKHLGKSMGNRSLFALSLTKSFSKSNFEDDSDVRDYLRFKLLYGAKVLEDAFKFAQDVDKSGLLNPREFFIDFSVILFEALDEAGTFIDIEPVKIMWRNNLKDWNVPF